MAKPETSTAVEDYLKAIFTLGEWAEGPVANASVAQELQVSTSSVSEMSRRLAGLGLVDHKRYGGVQLTQRGLAEALTMVRRHRLVETYLVCALGYSWDEVHADAEVLEHAVSPLLVERMERTLDFPWRDPHGDPIPTADGVVHQPEARPLGSVTAGSTAYVARIDDDDSALLRWFAEHGIGLDVPLEVLGPKPFGGATSVRLAGPPVRSLDLGSQAVAALWVTDEPPLATPVRGACHYRACRHLAGVREPEDAR